MHASAGEGRGQWGVYTQHGQVTSATATTNRSLQVGTRVEMKGIVSMCVCVWVYVGQKCAYGTTSSRQVVDSTVQCPSLGGSALAAPH